MIAMLAAVASSIPMAVATPARTSVTWSGDYETGDFSQWGDHVQANPGDAVIVTDPVRQGRYAAKFTVNPGDDPINSTGERSTVYVSTGEQEGVESWWGWSTMIAPGSVLYDGSWNNLTSWHHTGTTCPAPLHFALDASFHLRLDAWGGPLDETNCSNPYRQTFQLGTMETGRWYDFVFHVKWSADPNVGFVEVWLNGVHVLPKTYAATLYTGQGVYLKQGFYRGPTPEGTTVVYNDAMRRGQSYDDVAPAPSSTPPAPAPPAPTPPAPAPTPPAPPAPTPPAPAPAPPASAPTPTPPAPGPASAPPASVGSGTQAAAPSEGGSPSAGVKWGDTSFTSATQMRAYLATSGTSWEAFLRLHPPVARALGLKAVEYGEPFYTESALARWLAVHGQTYRGWEENHAAAARILAGQPADTRANELLSVSRPRVTAPRTLLVHAHGFPGGPGRIVVRDSRGRLLGGVQITVDSDGSINSVVALPNYGGQRLLKVAVSVRYPGGIHGKTRDVRLRASERRLCSRS